MAQICAILARQRHESLIEEMRAAGERNLSLVELRLDFLRSEPRLDEILRHRRCPVIVTLRRPEDGGRWTGSEDARQRLLRAAIVAGADYVDLEEDVASAIPRFGSTQRIVSHHDMNGMPSLPDLWGRLAKLDADIVKIAGMASKASDAFKMLRLVAKSPIPTVALAMGGEGLASRVLGAKFGSPFTYAAFNPERVVAPGLPTVDDLRDVYRYESISERTRVFGVIGDPIAHSLSPLIHNAAFAELGIDAVYLPFHVTKENLSKFLDRVSSAGIEGLSVTIPHKESILERGVAGDPLVSLCRSANTILIPSEGPWRIHNTDGPAALASIMDGLRRAHGPEAHIEGRSILILGAGGVARTMAFALQSAKALVTIASRKTNKAKDLAHEVGCRFVEWASRMTVAVDVIINATPVGMHPGVDDTPYHDGDFKESTVVFDTIYNPMRTRFLKEAEERGCVAVSGVDMFVVQAEAQFKIFSGQEPPTSLMKEIVLEQFSPARKMLREARLARLQKPRDQAEA